jgi:FG-GAP-like repeat
MRYSNHHDTRDHHRPCRDSRPFGKLRAGSRLSSRAKLGRCVQLIALVLLAAAATAQNPIPQIVGPVKPMAVVPGSGAFTLSVYGANFVPGAAVNWNYQPRSTTFVSTRELQAQILATDIAKNTAGLISVINPAPGGGSSSASWAQVEVHAPVSTITLRKPTPYAIGSWLLKAADFNHDGILDLIGEYGQDLDFYAGKGDGTFRFGSIAGRFYYGVVPAVYGDFNGDGNLDVIFPQGLDYNQPTQMAVMLGDGKGKFNVGPPMNDYSGFGLTVAGDFNGDGKLDLITKDRQFTVWLGNGDGTFQHFKDYPYSPLTTGMIAGDFNGDGKLDLILYQVGINLYFLEGNGDGTFRTPKQIASFPGNVGCGGNGIQYDLQLGDFNGDGKLDFAFCDQTQIGVLLGNGDGTFQPAVFYSAGTQGQFAYAIGDINSDGNQDLLVSQYQGNSNFTLAVLLGKGNGTFQAAQNVSIPQIPAAELGIVVGDFNSDGLLDFIFQTGGGMEVFIQE